MISFLSTFATTTDPSLKKNYPHIPVKGRPNVIFEMLLSYCKEKTCKNIKTNIDFFDIYGEKDGYDYSFSLKESGIDNYTWEIQISIFSKRKRGRCFTRLQIVYDEVLDKIIQQQYS